MTALPVTSALAAGGTMCLISGPPPDVARTTVLLLHGFGGSARHWEPLMQVLPSGVRAIAPDLPGHGVCELPCHTGDRRVLALITTVLDTCHAPAKVGLVGHSLGGLLAIRIAAALPNRVAWLGLLGSACRVSLHPALVSDLAAGRVDEDFLGASIADTPAREEAVRLVVDGFRALRLDDPARDIWGVRRADVTAEARRVTVPALVVVPGADRVVSPRKGRQLAQALPDGRLAEIPCTDHYVHLEDPEMIWRQLEPLALPHSVDPPPLATTGTSGGIPQPDMLSDAGCGR